jgi:hypothetical protein
MRAQVMSALHGAGYALETHHALPTIFCNTTPRVYHLSCGHVGQPALCPAPRTAEVTCLDPRQRPYSTFLAQAGPLSALLMPFQDSGPDSERPLLLLQEVRLGAQLGRGRQEEPCPDNKVEAVCWAHNTLLFLTYVPQGAAATPPSIAMSDRAVSRSR